MPVVGEDQQIFEIIDRQSYLGQEVINRYWYLLDNLSPPVLNSLASDFSNTVIGDVIGFQNEALTHLDLTIINHSNPASFGLFSINLDGLLVGTDLLPPFCALGVRLNRTSRELRNGQKRYAGIRETAQVDGIFDSGFLAGVAANVAGLTATLTESIRNYVPVIVRNKPTKTDLTIDPNDAATWKYVTIGGVTIKNTVTTQNSRKYS